MTRYFSTSPAPIEGSKITRLAQNSAVATVVLILILQSAFFGGAEAQWATRGHIAPKLTQQPSSEDSSGQTQPNQTQPNQTQPNQAPPKNSAAQPTAATREGGAAAPAGGGAEASAPVPRPRPTPPKPIKPRKPARIVSIGKLGPICDRPDLVGQPLASISDIGGCAVAAPVRLHSANGVAIAPKMVSGCGAPQALELWLTDHVQPAAEKLFGVRVARLHQVSAYVCRSRNGAAGAKLSFHATGDAIDIASFELSNGVRVSVLEDWGGKGPAGEAGAAFLRAVWKGACGPFGTVLGPEADAAHQDHFHFDVARRRRPFCQ